jgi:hypothetical protein
MGDITSPDYNKRQLVTKASYSKRASKLGIGMTVGTTVAGAVVGVATEPVKTNTSEQAAKPNAPANAVVGALVGYGVTSFINHVVLGQGKNGIPIDHQNNWISKKFGNDKIFLRNQNGGFWIIDRSIEESFVVRDMQDVNDFFTVFNDANLYTKDKVIAQAIKEVSREDLLTLLTLVPQTNHKRDLQDRYLTLSRTLDELYDAIERFPVVKNDAEKSIANKTNSNSEASKFYSTYSTSSEYADQVFNQTLNKLSRNEIPQLINLHANSVHAKKAQLRYIEEANSLEDFVTATERYRETANGLDVEKMAINRTRSLSDVKLYKKKYDYRKNESKLLKVASTNATRAEIPSIIYQLSGADSLSKVDATRQYASKSSTIKEALEAYNKYSEAEQAADERAIKLIDNVSSANDYINTFPYTYNNSKAKGLAANYLQKEFNSASSYKEKYDFFRKYYAKPVYDSKNLVKKALDEVYEEEKKYRSRFDNAFDYTTGNKTIRIGFKTNGNYPAFVYMEEAKKAAQVIDWQNPWVTSINYTAARGDAGILVGVWYKEGTNGDIMGAYSNEVNQFINKAEKALIKLTNGEVISLFAEYSGSRASDMSRDSYSSSDSDDSRYDYDEEKVSQNNTSACDGAEDGSMKIPSYENNDWKDGGEYADTRGGGHKYSVAEKSSYYTFNDNVKGTLYQNTDSRTSRTYNKYFVSKGAGDFTYYQTLDDAIVALYIYKKCGVMTRKGRL